jgi:hypothetical protein
MAEVTDSTDYLSFLSRWNSHLISFCARRWQADIQFWFDGLALIGSGGDLVELQKKFQETLFADYFKEATALRELVPKPHTNGVPQRTIPDEPFSMRRSKPRPGA